MLPSPYSDYYLVSEGHRKDREGGEATSTPPETPSKSRHPGVNPWDLLAASQGGTWERPLRERDPFENRVHFRTRTSKNCFSASFVRQRGGSPQKDTSVNTSSRRFGV